MRFVIGLYMKNNAEEFLEMVCTYILGWFVQICVDLCRFVQFVHFRETLIIVIFQTTQQELQFEVLVLEVLPAVQFTCGVSRA